MQKHVRILWCLLHGEEFQNNRDDLEAFIERGKPLVLLDNSVG